MPFSYTEPKIEISVVSDSAKEATERFKHLASQLDYRGDGHYDIPEVTDFGPVAVPEESAVPKYEIAPTLRVNAEGDPDSLVWHLSVNRWVEAQSTQDLAKAAR